ncbi:MAG: hypothetical protein KDE47_27700 [Caldilineaceae bacterium]|nr:hypothetical protein [Caldilineaceae bacterium]
MAEYEIRVKGHLCGNWHDWFGGMILQTLANGESRLHGPVADQAALFGHLSRIRDLGLELIAVSPLIREGEEEI